MGINHDCCPGFLPPLDPGFPTLAPALMHPFALSALAAIALSLPAFSQSMTWGTADPQGDYEFGNELVFSNGAHGFTATSWGYVGKKNHQSFQEGMSVVYPTGIGVTNSKEGRYLVPEHQLDNAKGNDWVLLVFDGPVDDVSIVVNPYGTWDRDVTYYTANLESPLDLSGLNYGDLGALGFSERVDDLSDRSKEARTVDITGGGNGSFNAILIGAQQGNPGKKGNVDRFKIAGVSANFVVPEPSSALLGLLGGLLLLRRRR